MHLKSLFPVVVPALLLLAGGCADGGGRPAARTTDDLGRSVAVPPAVERVVTLAPNLTELVYAAGAGDKLAGVTTADDYPPAVEALPRFSALPIDFEAVAALEPDLVLANDNVNSPRDVETFTALGFPVYFFAFQTLGDVLGSLRTMGDLLGSPDAAGRAADSLQAAMEALRVRTAAAKTRPLTLFLITDDVLYAFGRESYVHALIDVAGGHSATAGMDTVRPVLSEEFVLDAKPEVIVVASGEDYDPARLLAAHPTWDIVPAVADGRVYGVDPDLFLRPSPRLVEGARRLARRLHPTLFVEAPASL